MCTLVCYAQDHVLLRNALMCTVSLLVVPRAARSPRVIVGLTVLYCQSPVMLVTLSPSTTWWLQRMSSVIMMSWHTTLQQNSATGVVTKRSWNLQYTVSNH